MEKGDLSLVLLVCGSVLFIIATALIFAARFG